MKTVGLFAYGEMGEPVLTSLLTSYTIEWIILPPKKDQTASERSTEKLAKQQNIPVIYSVTQKDLFEHIRLKIPDVVIIATFNKILSEKILNLTKFINIHHGDLPRYRGRANVNWAIINGRKEIGLTIHEATPDLDAGNIYEQHLIRITQKDTVKTVYDSINEYLKKNIARVTKKVLNGYVGISQKGKASYCCTRLPEDGLIDWNKTSKELYNFIRALTKPYPGAFTYFEGKKMIIWSAEFSKKQRIYEGRIPGRIGLVLPNYGVEVLTGDSSIIIKDISYKGKDYNAAEIIKSVKKTLGINWVELYEKISTN